VGIPLQVLHDSNVEVGRNFLVFGYHFGIGNVHQVVSDHLAELLVTGSGENY